MAAVALTSNDLLPFADIPAMKADAMIADAMALAARVAPCITEADFAYPAAAKAVLRGAILRWADSGTGALAQAQVGGVSQTLDTRSVRRSLFWPSEISALQELCGDGTTSKQAFDVDTITAETVVHSDICALRFGALYCSCGAVLTMDLPLYENVV